MLGPHKADLIKPRRPWKGFDDLELATAEWVDWFNHRRPSKASKSPDSPAAVQLITSN